MLEPQAPSGRQRKQQGRRVRLREGMVGQAGVGRWFAGEPLQADPLAVLQEDPAQEDRAQVIPLAHLAINTVYQILQYISYDLLIAGFVILTKSLVLPRSILNYRLFRF